MTDFPHADQLRKTSTYAPASWISAQITRAGKRGEVETGFFFDDATGTEGPMLRRFLEDHGYVEVSMLESCIQVNPVLAFRGGAR